MPNNLKLLVLTRYARLGSSSRLRHLQYIPYIEKAGFAVTTSPLFSNAYVQGMNAGKRPLISIFIGYCRRCWVMLTSARFDMIWIEKECLPWLPYWVEFLLLKNKNIMIDYDDAIFHQYNLHRKYFVRKILSNKISQLMQLAQHVVVGNEYLRQYAIANNAKKISVVPTMVDLDKYQYRRVIAGVAPVPVVVGWIGSPATAKFLHLITPALAQWRDNKFVKFRAIGARPDQVIGTPFEAVPWSEASEVQNIQAIDIGIMPLADAAFEQGKCGYKLLQYMACGKPVVASPVGVNASIVKEGKNGFLAANNLQWKEALELLISQQSLRYSLGHVGKAQIEESYSLEKAAVKLIDFFKNLRIPSCQSQ